MRSADLTTLFRVLLVVLVAFLIIVKFDIWIIILLIAVAFILDAVDGYFAVYEASNGRFGFFTYIRAALGNKKAKSIALRFKRVSSKTAKAGPRIDVAGDRAVEYVFWILFTYLHLIPLILTLLIVIRHSFVDALMGARGTSSKMNSAVGRVLYASNASRFLINVAKFAAFGYLALVYVSGYPVVIGYVLIGILFAFVMARGLAEVYDSYKQ